MLLFLAALAGLGLADDFEFSPIKKKGAGPLFRIHHGDKWGFMDRTGRVVIEPRFEGVGDFFEGLARVSVTVGTGSKQCFIDETGKIVIPCAFDGARDFAEGLAPVRTGRLWGYIDRTGKIAIPPQFQGAAEFSEGLGRFLVWDRIQCGGQMYNRENAPSAAFGLHDVTALMADCTRDYDQYGYVNKSGQVVVKPRFSMAKDFSEGLALVRVGSSTTSKYGFIDKTGAVVIPPQFDHALSFSEGFAAVLIGVQGGAGKGEWGFIDRTGKFAIRPQFWLAFSFSEGLARAWKSPVAGGFIDRAGRFAFPPQYGTLGDFSEGLATARSGDQPAVYIDRQGSPVLRLKAGEWGFSDGLTIAGQHGMRVYVDRTGKTIAPYEVNPAIPRR